MTELPLVIGGVLVPTYGRVGLAQSYAPVGGVFRGRMASGRLVQQIHWRRLRTTIQGLGWVPAGVDLIDYDEPVVIDCIAPRSVLSASTSVALPDTRRPDADVVAHARTGTEDWVRTSLAMDGDAAQITPVSGALQYQVRWYPRLTCFLDPPEERLDAETAEWSWTLTAEEV